MSDKVLSYEEVVKWVECNFLDVRVYNCQDGRDIGQGITVDWGCKRNHASYLRCESPEGKVSKKIVVWEFDNLEYKTLALLHELGHHTECQDGGNVYQERKAWEGCFKWMRYLGLPITKDILNKASQWFSSYLDFYRCVDENKDWLAQNGMGYVETPKEVNNGIDVALSYNLVDRNNHYPVISKYQEVDMPSVQSTPKSSMYGKESWRKHWK